MNGDTIVRTVNKRLEKNRSFLPEERNRVARVDNFIAGIFFIDIDI